MTDPLFIILSSLKTMIERITGIFSFIFINYFPDTPPMEDNDMGSVKI